MNSQDLFDQFYRSHQGPALPESLLQFFESIVRPRLIAPKKILDLGCGNFSLFECVKNLEATVIAVDFSQTAIDQAPKSNIIYQHASVTDKKVFPASEFDLVMDSHCLNCLVEKKDRDVAFKNIFEALRVGGLFAAELMVQPIDRNISMPLKAIKTARELEEEILWHNFKILYFMISKDSFVNELNGEEILCDVLRVIAKKES